jgi:hypothetical protein
MPSKLFSEMTLDEMWEFERTHSFNIGRSVVTKEGFKRHQARLAAITRSLVKRGKRQAKKPLVSAR